MDKRTMNRRRLGWGAGWLLAASGLALACSDSQEPTVGTAGPSPFVVSGPVRSSATSVSGEGASALTSAVVFVSLPPGTIPGGRVATIRDSRICCAVTAIFTDGGFDPVTVPAAVGDTLVVVVQVGTSGRQITYTRVVPEAEPPIVVRTSPPPHKRDVPLNASIVVVFSQPIDPATLTTGSVQLWHDTTLVRGTVEFRDPMHIWAEFQPDSPLAKDTDYRLVVTSAIRDMNGLALESPAEVSFTTGATLASPARLVFLGSPGSVGVAQPFAVQVAVLDSLGGWLGTASDSLQVTLVLGDNRFGAKLGGTLTRMAVKGIASFDDLTLDRAGAGYMLVAFSGTLGGALSAPIAVLESSRTINFASVSAGALHSCGVTAFGKGYCWGNNASGQLGNGTMINSTTPVAIAGGLAFASVSAGLLSTCGVTTAGAAYCWGGPALGADSATRANGCITQACPIPLRVAGGLRFSTVSVGDHHACGVTTNGAAYCWGVGPSGEIGAGFTDYSSAVANVGTPVAVTGGLTFDTVSAGHSHTCGLTLDGSAYCWGDNSLGQLGGWQVGACPNGQWTGQCSFSPVPVQGGLTFTGLGAGDNFTCATATTGAAYCWGDNSGGQLGTGDSTGPENCGTSPCSAKPVEVSGGLRFTMTSAKGMDCGISTSGAAYCWHTIPGTPMTLSAVPVQVPGGLTFASVSAGYRHACGMTTAGVAYCWGNNSFGELGDSTTTSSSVPVKVAGQS
jgi:alpha-tubulin suppressor-like RCC1 family protein